MIQQPLWDQAPRLEPISLVSRYGALAISFSIFGVITLVSIVIERRARTSNSARSTPNAERSTPNVAARSTSNVWLRGPWPLVAGALGLAAVNIATLALAGRPWGVTSAFALWGSTMVAATGVDVAAWPYW